ncbi:MAG TPA: glycerol-3-phosphate dehydrogenase/oxidase [Gaiellaceae bacterium]|nr:glycerol-3-phosphate dehydrogenase/oxidase [Gaiellaceae bacterium]
MVLFDAAARRRALERMAEGELDVLVVGGGITGCGVALDAATRGLSVGLVEADDFASGTSGRSSRLVHGGVRYMAQRELGLVRESLRERDVLLRNAPHLVRPLPVVFPVAKRSSRASVLAGLVLYDVLGARRVARHRRLSADETARSVPGFGARAPALVYTECATDDARLTVQIARTAAANGALVANHARVEELLGEGGVRGALVRDQLTGERLEVRARTTVNATGVWATATQGFATATPQPHVTSKGIHLVFRPGAIRTTTGAIIGSQAGDGRLLFVIPWEGRVYVGTTDTRYEGPLEDPVVDEESVDYILAAVAAAFPGVGHEDVVAAWAGLRPLADHGDGPTADLSRRHEIYEGPPGLLTVTGGKLTTYRAMAQAVVDRISTAPCRTGSIPLGLTRPLAETLAAAGEHGARLVRLYGDDWAFAAERLRDEPALADPFLPELPVLAVEAELAVSREMALTDADIARRLRLASFGVTPEG